MNQASFDASEYMGKPIVGIFSTRSDMNMGHMHFRELAEQVKRGVLEAGGFPVEIPVMSLGEITMKPWSSFYRNLVSMENRDTSCRCMKGDDENDKKGNLDNNVFVSLRKL